jgi:predicted ATPase
LSWAFWHDGYPDQSVRTADRALLHAREFGHAHTLGDTLWHTVLPAVLSRDVQRVERLANENATISGEHGFPFFLAHCDVELGWVAAHRGQPAYGIDRMRRGIAAAAATGSHFEEPFYLALVAEALASTGEVEDGIAVIDQALARSALTGENWADAELHRLRGDLLYRLSRPDMDQAERSFRAALSIAREQGTKGFELRAATSLSQLLSNEGRREEAQQLLAPVYSSFTEGFDTVDLKEAKALLAALV